MILFETTTSVFELMWDIALAFFVVRIAFMYFIFTYLSSLFLSFIQLKEIMPYNHLTVPAQELVAFPLYILIVALWARAIIVYYEIPRVAGFRIAIGLVAGVFMVIAELVGGFILWEEGYQKWIWETELLGAGLGIASLILFESMLWILMALEKAEKNSVNHEHGQKSIVEAV